MRFLAAIGALAIIVAIGAAVFFFGGFFNVSATEEDPKPVAWALQKVREASIDRHAKDTPTISLEDVAVIQAGAKAFAARGCANCHGAPGVMWAKFSEGMRPDPPDLKDVAGELEPREIFYAIKNGINMTGMPSFARIEVGDPEIWQIVAFIKKLPTVSEADYKTWTEAPADAPAEKK
jgi:mono/diheme cytochrome c family protein